MSKKHLLEVDLSIAAAVKLFPNLINFLFRQMLPVLQRMSIINVSPRTYLPKHQIHLRFRDSPITIDIQHLESIQQFTQRCRLELRQCEPRM